MRKKKKKKLKTAFKRAKRVGTYRQCRWLSRRTCTLCWAWRCPGPICIWSTPIRPTCANKRAICKKKRKKKGKFYTTECLRWHIEGDRRSHLSTFSLSEVGLFTSLCQTGCERVNWRITVPFRLMVAITQFYFKNPQNKSNRLAGRSFIQSQKWL